MTTRRQRQSDAATKRSLDLASVLSTPAGRRFIWALSVQCGVHAASFSQDASIAAYGEGRRSVGLQLLADAQRADKRAYVQMLTELMPVEEVEPVDSDEDE